MVEKGSKSNCAKRLIVNINRLREYSSDYAEGYICCAQNTDRARVLNSPIEFIPAFEQAVKDIANNISPSESPVYVGLEGSFGDNMISPRYLNASHLGKTICVEAIVTRCMIFYDNP